MKIMLISLIYNCTKCLIEAEQNEQRLTMGKINPEDYTD